LSQVENLLVEEIARIDLAAHARRLGLLGGLRSLDGFLHLQHHHHGDEIGEWEGELEEG
jgi:hypothetical protein